MYAVCTQYLRFNTSTTMQMQGTGGFYFFATSGTSVATLQKTLRVSWEGQQKVLARPHWNLFSKGCPYCSFGASRSRGAGLVRMVETLQEWEGNATPKVRADKYDHWFYSCAWKKIDIDIITTYYRTPFSKVPLTLWILSWLVEALNLGAGLAGLGNFGCKFCALEESFEMVRGHKS